MRLSSPIVVVLLAILLAHGVSGGRDCKTNEDYDSESPFIGFFDACFLDTTDTYFFGSIATQIITWFNVEIYPVYVLIAVFVVTMTIFNSDNMSSEDSSRGNCVRLHGYMLIVRLGMVTSMIPWLWAAMRQERPCVCWSAATNEYEQLNGTWGMPAAASFAATVFGLHFTEQVNVVISVFFTIIVSLCGLATGDNSLGQIIVGMLFGIAVHFYTTRTPIFIRLLDFILTFIAGVITLFVTKAQYPAQDFSFAISFVIGIVWQLFGFALIIVSYDWEFVRVVIRRSTHYLHPVDFLYYKPLNSPPSSGLDQSNYPRELLWMTVITIILFFVLCALRFSQQYVNDILSV